MHFPGSGFVVAVRGCHILQHFSKPKTEDLLQVHWLTAWQSPVESAGQAGCAATVRREAPNLNSVL